MKFNFLSPRTKALCKSYGKDWGLVFVVLAAFSYIDTLEPYHRQFSVKDTTIQHPFDKHETVPIWLALVLAFVLPGIIISLFALKNKSTADLHNGLLGLFLAEALVLIVTDSVKIAVGRPRPDFLDRCLGLYDNFAEGTPITLLQDPVNMLSNSSICTRTDLLKDGFKSFPSGHSSFSFGGLGYLSMFIAGKLHLFDERGHIYKSIVVLAPLILAALIAISRVDNYRHHWQDVTVGSFIGIVFAVFSYRQYYPSLAAAKCGNPFTPRGADALVSTLLPLRNDPDDDDTPDHIAHRQAFLNNPDQGSSMYRNSTADTLISTPNVHGGNNIYKNSSYNMDSQNGQRNNNGR